jgi:methionine synthase I (cobalamin-dependent)
LVQAFQTADALLLETWSDVKTAQTFLHIAKDTSKLPVLVSFTFRRSGPAGEFLTFRDLTPAACALGASEGGAHALGVNCGRELGMEDLAHILRCYRSVTNLPLFARPNAGTPARVADCWMYPHQDEDLAAQLPRLLDAGAIMVGGCCGTTPATIAAFRDRLRAGCTLDGES